MKNNKILNIIKRIVAVTIAIGLICLITFFSISFLGNPIEALKAKREIKKYVELTYGNSGIKFEDNKVHYNFKFNEYYMELVDDSKLDTKFCVTYRKGTIDDEYEFRLPINAMERLEKKYREYVSEIVKANNPNDDITNIFVMLKKEEVIEPETPFDVNNEMFDYAIIDITYKKLDSIADAASKMKSIYDILEDNNIKYERISVECEFDESYNRITVMNISREKIGKDNLEEYINYVYNNEDKFDEEGVIIIKDGEFVPGENTSYVK